MTTSRVQGTLTQVTQLLNLGNHSATCSLPLLPKRLFQHFGSFCSILSKLKVKPGAQTLFLIVWNFLGTPKSHMEHTLALNKTLLYCHMSYGLRSRKRLTRLHSNSNRGGSSCANSNSVILQSVRKLSDLTTYRSERR